ncbi:MAG: flagellar hook assembly protein FlgD [Alphaproteobacteria bacterium]
MAGDVTINNALDFAQRTQNSSAQLASDFDDFLVLLTTQLQNQDPLAPMDSTEFTNQLVNFAGVEQQINQNSKLDSLVSLALGSSFSSSLSYVGKDISYLSSEAHFDGSTPVDINYAIQGASVDTTINIINSDGQTVFSQKVSDDDNVEAFSWDGTNDNGDILPEGTYEIRVDALDGQDNSLETTTVVTGHVGGIETQNGTTFLLVGERAVSVGNVIKVSEPKQPQQVAA